MLQTQLRALFAVAVACLLFAGSASAGMQSRVSPDALKPLSAPLAVGAKVRLHNIPLDDGVPASLDLERFEVYSSDAVVQWSDGAEPRRAARAALTFFRGRVSGDQESLVFISVGDRPRGFVLKGDRRFRIGSFDRGTPRSRQLDDTYVEETTFADAVALDAPESFRCALDGSGLSPEAPLHPANLRQELAALPVSNALLTGTATYTIRLAVETDGELYDVLSANTSAVNAYVANIVGAMSTIYRRDLGTDVQLVYQNSFTNAATDPFGEAVGAVDVALDTLQARWYPSPPAAVHRSAVMLFSGKNGLAGIANADVLCDNRYAYGVISSLGRMPGTTYSVTPPNVPDPNANPGYGAALNVFDFAYWQIVGTAHELGHIVESPHTHCIAWTAADQTNYGVAVSRSFIDTCYSGEGGGCYSNGSVGAVNGNLPPEKGTIMSYCHLITSNPGGYGMATRYTFGLAGEPSIKVVDRMKTRIAARSPSSPTITAPASVSQNSTGNAASASATGATQYYWRITNGTFTGAGASGDGSSATGASVTFSVGTATPVTLTAQGANAGGCAATDLKSVTVAACTGPTITSNTASHTIAAGASTTLSVSATGASLTYAWYVGTSGNTATPAGSGSSIVVSPANTTSYWVRVTNSCSSVDSSTIVVTVPACSGPAITSTSVSKAITAGSSTQLSVEATGTSVAYAWYVGASGNTASPAGSGSSITVSPASTTNYWVRVTGSCGSVDSGTITITVVTPPVTSSRLYLVTPCRLIDTRNAIGPYGGPAAAPNDVRQFVVTTQCGIPTGAKAVSLNVTAVAPSTGGWLTAFPTGGGLPSSSTMNFRTGKTRANNAIISLSPSGGMSVYNSGPNAVHFIIDVNGYFN